MAEKGPKLKILPFDVTGDRLDIGRLWSRWLERFERELVYQGVVHGAKPELAKAALLIHAGVAVEDIHDSLPDGTTKPEGLPDAEWTSYRKSKDKFSEYFTPDSCNDFAIFELINIKMRGDETVAGYTLRLREGAKKCCFDNWNAEKMIKVLVISNMRDNELPGIDEEIERKVKLCRQCQAVQDNSQDQPIKPHELPSGPWQQTEMDFQGPYPTGEYIFVLIDRYTRWPEVKIMQKAPDAKMTINAFIIFMKDIFVNKGTPELCQSDSGPPFQSQEMSDFAQNCGYDHKHVTPEWTRANGMVERFNRSMKEAVQAAHLEGRTVRDAAEEFLEVYRATPHSATKVSPYEAMHGGRRMKTTLPMLSPEGQIINRDREQEYKERMANKGGGKQHRLKVGDKVLIKQPKRNKLTPRYNPVEMTVTEIKGSSIVATDGRTSVFRDASYFKQIESEDEDEQTTEPNAIEQPVTDARETVDADTPQAQEQDGDPGPALQNGTPQAVTQTSVAQGRPRRERHRPVRLADYV